jgi:hypothetical protein
MQYALLVYSPAQDTAEEDTAEDQGRAARPMPGAVAAQLGRPDVAGWIRLHADESATTLRGDSARTLVTDGPFIDSKEYLAGLILIEAGDLDGALATAGEMLRVTRPGTAIEVRPVLDAQFHGA